MSQLCSFFRKTIFFGLSTTTTQHVETWLHGQISVRWQPCSLLTKKQEYAMTICTVHVFFFCAKAPIGTCQILQGCAESPGKLEPTGRKPGCCFCHYLGMTLVVYGRGLCAWRCKYSTWFAQTLAANES